MRKAYSYARFSTRRQEQGDSLIRQIQASRAYCEKQGYTLTELSPDKGISAFKGANRIKGSLPKFLAMIEAGQVKPGEILIVESLDRLSRQEPLDALDLFSAIVRAGIEIHTLQPYDVFERKTINKGGKLHVVLALMQRANEESEMKSFRVREVYERKMKEARESKALAFGRVPGWIDIVEGKPVLNVHAETVRKIVKWGLDGLGTIAVAKKLNEAKLPTMSRKGYKTWSISVVREVWDNKKIIGEYQPTHVVDGKRVSLGDPIPGYYPAVISENEFYRLQAVIDARRKMTRGRQAPRIINLFGTLLVDNTGSRMTTSMKRGRDVRMISMDALHGLAPWRSFSYDAFEEAFFKWVVEVDISEKPETSEGLTERRQLAEVKERIAKLRKALIDGGEFGEGLTLLRELSARENQLAQAVDKIETKRAKPTGSTKDIAELLADTTNDQQVIRARLRVAIANLIEKIMVEITDCEGGNYKRWCCATIHLSGNRQRCFLVETQRGKTSRSYSEGWIVEAKAG